MAFVELRCAKDVASESEEYSSCIPAAGKTIKILSFHGSAAFTQNSFVGLIWDYEGAGEELIWSIKGEGKMPEIVETKVGDGVKKMAVVLSNSESGSLIMSGYASMDVR